VKYKLIITSLLMVLMYAGISLADTIVNNTSNTTVPVQPTSNTTINSNTQVDVPVGNVGNVDQTFEAGKRSYPIGQAANFAALPSYFGDNNRPGHQFMPLDKIIMYTPLWDMTSVKKMDAARSWGENLNITPLIAKVDSGARSKTMLVTKAMMDTNRVNVWQLAFGTLNATNEDILSSDLFAGILVAASEYGATHVQFFAEGTNTELETEGVGIGFNYTKATDSSVSTGGTGWSKGWSGYHNLPWLQFVFLRVEPKDSMAIVQPRPVVKMAPVAVAPPTDYKEEVAVPSTKIADQAPEVDMAVKATSAKKQ
jgi:hypothetical protein